MEGTTRGATADQNIGPPGRDPDCNMASSTRGSNKERVHTARAGPPAAKTPPVGDKAGQRGKGVLPGIRAEESYTPNTTPGGTRRKASGRLSPPAPLPPVVDSGTEGERGRAKWFPGSRVGHSVLFHAVRSVLFHSFLEFLATYETQKNVPFFLKERKRMQRMFHSF